MDRPQQVSPSLDELRKIQYDARTSTSLKELREYFERVQELRRIHSGNFDLQLIVAEAQDEIIGRARELRRSKGDASIDDRPAFTATPPLFPSETPDEVAEPAGQPPPVNSNWRRATILALILTAVICAVFFYLIQTARKINMPQAEKAPAAQPQKPPPVQNASDQVTPPLATQPSPTLRLYTDLVPGTVSIDNGTPQDLKDGEFVLDNLQEGRHAIKVAGRSGSADFSFSIADKSAPEIVGPPASSNALVVLVATADGKGKLLTNSQPSELTFDGSSLGPIPVDGLALSDLGTKDHELLIVRPKDRQRFVMTYTPAPVLTVYVKSDPNAGTAVVTTKEDGVSVTIDDKPYRRKSDHGQLRIPLRVGFYVLKVHKDGFIDPSSQRIEIKKSEESQVTFDLQPIPDIASLRLRGATPNAKVYVDNELSGTVGGDGTAVIANIRGGDRVIDLRLDGYKGKRIQRKFQAGETVVLGAPDTILEKEVAEAKPATPAPAAPAETPKALDNNVALPGEQVRRGGGFVHYNTPKNPGHYSFEAHGKIGGFLKHGKLQWYAGYQDSQNFVMFSLDGKHATIREMRDGKSTEVARINFNTGSDEWVQVDMAVHADSINTRIKTRDGGWSELGQVSSPGRDFTQDKVGFYIPGSDEVAVSNFRFSSGR